MSYKGTVKALDNEKGKVTLSGANGRDFYFYIGKGVDRGIFKPGANVEYESYKPEGKSYSVIKTAKIVGVGGKSGNGNGNHETGIDGITEPGLRFISNIVGQAITAGKVITPNDIRIWTLASREALLSLSQKPQPRDDEPDPSELEPDPYHDQPNYEQNY